MLCRAVPCCVLCCNNSFVHARSHSTKYHPAVPRYNTTSGLYAPGTALLNHIICSQLSSAKAQQRAAQRSAVRCRAVRCRAVPCRALRCGAEQRRGVLCRAVPCCVLCCTLYFVHVRFHSTKYHPAVTRYYRTSGLYVPGTTLLNRIKCSQLSSAQLSYNPTARSAAPFGAVRCRAVPCFALRCGAVPCRAALCFLSNIQQYEVSCEVPGTRYRYVLVCTCLFAFFIDFFPSRSCSSFFFRILHPYCRSERDIASKHRTRHRQGHELCTSSSWRDQNASCTKSWVSYFCPLHILLKSYLRERSGRRQPPAERSPCAINTKYLALVVQQNQYCKYRVRGKSDQV